ncbi:MAG: hypothetical protein HEQ29_14915 [Dolichospermum sp. LBC05a]|nr:hypothetical protein [Dolichospermum sp. OL01]MCO5798000.1 hypothetical protein [Dolichospermum sp. OL03]MCS6281666.1 hypothetical protein [Dolichospermum sp.]QSV59480.1 MAG: hypothetical protein HEQ29_14915 [Dolichospermum sp. LBC05a]
MEIDRKELRLAIEDAYKTKSSLKMMLSEEFSEELRTNLEDIDGENLREKIFHLIEKFESESKLKELILAARKGNPNNQKLKDIQEKLFPNIVDKPINPASEYWNSLHYLLNKIGLNILEKVCRITLKNNPKNQDIDGNYLELKNIQELATLKEILLEKYPKNQLNKPTIIEFAQRLTNEDSIRDIHSSLSEWINTVADKLNYKEPFYQDKPKSSTIAKPYLMIIAEPKGDDKFNLNAELIIDSNTQPIKVGEQRYDCLWDNIKDEIDAFLGISFQQHLRNINREDLTIELFLPFSHLDQDIDIANISVSSEENRAIGYEYKFLVRSIERIKEQWGSYMKICLDRWENNTAQIFHIQDNWNNCTDSSWIKWENSWGGQNIDDNDNNVLIKVVTVGCGLPFGKIKNKFFITLIRGGVPISIWTRCNFPFTQQDSQKLSQINNNNFESSLIESVWRKRREAYQTQENGQNHLGYHLGFLCDNPHRIPICLQDNNQSLIETGN